MVREETGEGLGSAPTRRFSNPRARRVGRPVCLRSPKTISAGRARRVHTWDEQMAMGCPPAVSTQRNLAAAKPALRDGGSLLCIVSWLAGRGEGDDEACGEVDVDCPFQPGLIWKCTAILPFLILLFFPEGCNGEEQEQELVGAGGAQRLELGALMGTQQPQVTTSVLRHQP